MPFALGSDPSTSELSEAVNYLLNNFGANIAADPTTGEITGPTGTVIAYLYKYLAVKYADSADGSLNFSDDPTNRQYYGLRNSNSDVESTNPADYIWFKVAGGFGTTKFLWYQTGGGRQISIIISDVVPALGYVKATVDPIDLDIITSTLATPAFLAYFQPAALQVIRSGTPLTPNFTGVIPALYATAGGVQAVFTTAQTDSDPAFGNGTWRIGNSATTGNGDITYNQITIGLPTNGGGYAVWPTPTAMSGTPASLTVPVRYKDSLGNISQASPAVIQFVFIDYGQNGNQIAYPSVYQWNTSIPTITGTSTYTWSSNTFSPVPTGWSLTPGTGPAGFNLYRAQVTLSAVATATTSTINWTTASVLSIGSAGANGTSSRICFARVAGNPSPTSGNITTTGSTSFPSSSQSSSTWGFSASWGASDPNPSSTNSLYQADGVYDPSTNTTTWTTPYISSLKVGQLSAVAVNTGALTVQDVLTVSSTGSIKGGQTDYATGSGFFLGYSGGAYKISVGSFKTGTANVSTDAITSAGHGYTANTQITFTSVGSVTGISVGKVYYIVGVTTDTFQVSASVSGSAINLTGSSSTVSFTTQAFYWDGSALTISGNMLGGTIKLGSGNTLNGYAFEVTASGAVYADNIFGGLGQFTNYYYNSEALRGITDNNRNYPGLIGYATVTNTAAGAHGARGQNFYTGAAGLVGGANNYDFYADGSGTNYGPFTGTHDSLVIKGAAFTVGDIVVDQQIIAKNGVSSTISLVSASNQPNQMGVLGVVCKLPESLLKFNPAVYIQEFDPETQKPIMSPQYYTDAEIYDLMPINAVGEGQINVCGENGNINVGDLIVSSSTVGKGMKQSDDVIRSQTVAKSRESVTFSSPDEIKVVACIYLGG